MPVSHRPAAGALALAAVAVVVVAGGAAASGSLPSITAAGDDIEDLSAYEPQRECDPVPRPGVEAFRDLVLERFDDTRDGGIARACDVGQRSEHKEGRAWDWMVDAEDPGEAAEAEALIGWLLATDEDGNEHAMARRLGVMYIIFDGRIWGSARSEEGWRDYDGANPHVDHVHFSFSRAGAAKETSFWDDPVPLP